MVTAANMSAKGSRNATAAKFTNPMGHATDGQQTITEQKDGWARNRDQHGHEQRMPASFLNHPCRAWKAA